MKKRILSIFAVLAVAVNMVGCTPPNTAAPAEVTEQIIVETTAESVEIQEINQLEAKQALTFDEVNRIEINGIEVSLPFKIEDLGEGYSIGEVQGGNEKIPAVFYNNSCICVIDYDNKNNIISAAFTSDSFKENEIKICSLSSKDNFENIILNIGTPTKQKELALLYKYENGEIYFGSENGEAGFNYLKITFNGGIENE